MPKVRELIIQMEDQPGTLGRACEAMAESGATIVAFEAFPLEGRSVIRVVVDNPNAAKQALDARRIYCTEAEVVLAELPHRQVELGHAASRLGEAGININYTYCGTHPRTNAPLIVFGVADATRAAMILDEMAARAA